MDSKKVDDVQRLLADVGAYALSEPDPEPEPDGFSVPKPTGSFHWLMVSRTSAALTPGNDWEPYFYDYTVANRFESIQRTAGGEFQSAGTISGRVYMAMLSFQAIQPTTVKAFLSGSSFGRIQIKVNETRTEYTANAFLSIPIKQGMNRILIMADSVDQLTFDALILREPHTRWIDPSRRGADSGGLVDAPGSERSL